MLQSASSLEHLMEKSIPLYRLLSVSSNPPNLSNVDFLMAIHLPLIASTSIEHKNLSRLAPSILLRPSAFLTIPRLDKLIPTLSISVKFLRNLGPAAITSDLVQVPISWSNEPLINSVSLSTNNRISPLADKAPVLYEHLPSDGTLTTLRISIPSLSILSK